MQWLFDEISTAVDKEARILLAMLPGVNDTAASFLRHGVIDAVRARGWPVDAVAVDTEFDLYAKQTLVDALDARVISPARQRGYRRVWLLGTSLGGKGALSYARAHPGEVEGIVVLAPYLGIRRTIAEVMRAGGLAGWQPAVAADIDDGTELGWLAGFHAFLASRAAPRIYLGYGRDDPFAPSSVMLAAQLPPSRTVVIDGGHDWPTWMALWRRILDQTPFDI